MKQQNTVPALIEKLNKGIEEIMNSEQYQAWLNTLSHFHNYSYRNTLLIYLQNNKASYVAGYKTWQTLNRHVKKGEKAIAILAPLMKKTEQVTYRTLPDGTVITDIQEEMEPMGFKYVNVFDISQTEGQELPTITVKELLDDVQNYDSLFQAIVDCCPVPVSFCKIENGAKGYYSPLEQQICIQEHMSPLQTIKTLVHECAHARLHSDCSLEKSRGSKEVEAESVAYVVCQYFNLDTTEYSFPYISIWRKGKTLEELKASLQRITDTASVMIDAIESAFLVLTDAD